MSRRKLILTMVLTVAVITTFVILPGCAGQATTTTAAAETTAAETTTTTAAAETTAAETTTTAAEGAYSYYEQMREAAKAGKEYPDAPAKGFSLAYTDINGGMPFTNSVWQSVQDQWKLAGGDPAKLYYADNRYDATIGLKNADIMLAKKPDVLINFQFDSKVNNIIAQKFSAANIPIIAVDVPTPGAPFMGVNNFQAAYMAGEAAVKLAEEKGGIDKLDNIILGQFPAGGEVLMLRSEGFYQAFVDKYGAEKVDPKTIRFDGGAGEAEQANKAMTDVLSKIPNAKVVALTSINEQTMSGIISAIQTAGRWDPENWIIITMGCDEDGQKQIRDGLTDGAVAFFPEHYGEYIIPAAVALMHGQPVPPFLYVENEVITLENIDQYYPQK